MQNLPELVEAIAGRDFEDALEDLHHQVRRNVEYVRDGPDELRPDGQRLADERHGVTRARDHWQSPQETLTRGAGDCEDCAILSYAALRMAGADVDDVALRYCQTPQGPHMICQARADANSPWYALDLLQSDPVPVEELERRHGYRLGYTLNESGLTLDGELRSNIVAQWDRVLTQLAELDDRFTIDLAG